jgi:hypothetical protein
LCPWGGCWGCRWQDRRRRGRRRGQRRSSSRDEAELLQQCPLKWGSQNNAQAFQILVADNFRVPVLLKQTPGGPYLEANGLHHGRFEMEDG